LNSSSIGTIIFSIHQPRYSIFKLFDTVLLLSSGHTVYLGSSNDILSYFSFYGFQCEEHDNPADFALDLLIHCNNQSSTELQTAYLQSIMHANYENLFINENDHRLIDEVISRSYIDELYYVCIRTFLNTIRDPAMIASQIIVATLLALLTGLVFNKIQATVETGVQNRLGVIFFVIVNQIFSTATALEPLVQERALFIHVKDFFQREFQSNNLIFCLRKMPVVITEYRLILLQN
jgi:ATP-binding cassette subfamily G (WHITE) protein 2